MFGVLILSHLDELHIESVCSSLPHITTMSKKRAIDSFFTTTSQKKPRVSADESQSVETDLSNPSSHVTYPYPVPRFSESISNSLATVPESVGKEINHLPELDVLYFQPYIPREIERDVFEFLRSSLFFYRVRYTIKRGGIENVINTPRFTTVFGVDDSSIFSEAGDLLDRQSSKPVPPDRYKACKPRPLPHCLDHLRQLTEIFTGAEYNFCLVNYYASGADSISYHSDDERFLGPDPSIASFSLGATRDFCMKHKSVAPSPANPDPEVNSLPPLKLPLASGDMILMRGKTQANWLHCIPKRKGKGSEGGRINITFRKGVKAYATENYYQYNVGKGEVWKWNTKSREMREWKKS